MESFGHYLRRERESRGISLEDVFRRTRISMPVLQALESGDTSNLPTRVILRGFIKSYAKAVGLNPEEALRRFEEEAEEAALTDPAVTSVRSVPEVKRPRIIPMAALALGTIIAMTAFLRYMGEQGPSSVMQAPPPAVAPAPVPQAARPEPAPVAAPEAAAPEAAQAPGQEPPQAMAQAHTPAAAPLPLAPAAPQEARPSGQPHLLKVQALEQTWLRMARDDGSVKEYLLQPGEQVVWEAAERFVLTVGNAAGLALSLNGQPLGPLGEHGEVVNLTLPQPAATRVAPAPRPAGPTTRPSAAPPAARPRPAPVKPGAEPAAGAKPEARAENTLGN